MTVTRTKTSFRRKPNSCSRGARSERWTFRPLDTGNPTVTASWSAVAEGGLAGTAPLDATQP